MNVVSWICCLMLVATVAAAEPVVPEKGVCRTCEVRGGGHGLEKVAAWREVDGVLYTFCAKGCAEAFDAFPSAYIPQPLPRKAPEVTFTTLDGKDLKLASTRGQLTLVDFWATWCAPCIQAMPELNALHEAWSDEGLRILGVSIDEEPQKKLPKFLKKKELLYQVALDSGSVPGWQQFHVAAIPAMFLIDSQGNIVAEWKGKVPIENVRETVERHLSAFEEPARD